MVNAMEVGDEQLYALTDNMGCVLTLYELLEILTAVKPFYDTVSDRELERLNDLRRKRLRDESNRRPSPKRTSKSYPGYVYLLQSGPYYKIGVSRNVDKRITQLATLPPFDLELVCVLEAADMYTLEHDLHHRFSEKRLHGEWFELTQSDVAYIEGLRGDEP
jgi:hypothetical protein